MTAITDTPTLPLIQDELSLLAELVALDAQRVIEPEDNPFLRAFYEGERGAGFQAQFAFLVRRFEQLRALEAGMRVGCARVAHGLFGVDTPADLTRARAMLASEQKTETG